MSSEGDALQAWAPQLRSVLRIVRVPGPGPLMHGFAGPMPSRHGRRRRSPDIGQAVA